MIFAIAIYCLRRKELPGGKRLIEFSFWLKEGVASLTI